VAVDRNTQINFQGDPARELAFIQNQDTRTGDVARASEPQLVVTSNDDLNQAIRAADVLDPTVGAGYEAPDALPGSEQGAHVNAEFEDNVRTGADASGDAGAEAEKVEEQPLPEQSNVEIADPEGGDLVENKKSSKK
jgi:hypothetical protein